MICSNISNTTYCFLLEFVNVPLYMHVTFCTTVYIVVHLALALSADDRFTLTYTIETTVSHEAQTLSLQLKFHLITTVMKFNQNDSDLTINLPM